MSKATRSTRERRGPQAGVSRVTRSTGGQDVMSRSTPQGRGGDSGLASHLHLMSVSEDHTLLPRKQRQAKGSVHGGSQSGSGPAAPALTGSVGPRGGMACRGGLAPIARLVKLGRLKNVVVVAGAGISTSSGIPDFRTPGTGLYANLRRHALPYPEAIFNIEFFSSDPRPFFSLAKELYPGRHRPNYVHYFLCVLHQKGLLLRLYTQNIDGLERMCGIPEDKLVEAHGSFATASCHLCYTPYPPEEAKRAIISDRVPVCTFCEATVKPDVVFFGEDLPEKYFQHQEDFPQADLLVIMGTSLQIEPFASLVNTVKSSVPRLLLNRDAVGPFLRKPLRRGDYMELGDLVDSTRKFAEILGWHSEIQELMESQESRSPPAVIAPPCGRGPFPTHGPPGVPAEPQDGGGPPGAHGAPGPGSGTEGSEDDSETDSRSTESSGPSH